MPIFQPKHQKLILQCYPPGRGFDKKPNSSELSYLLYYASTRRVKLEKVGKFIQKKNAIDISRNRTGNVQVTLEIINSLIRKCPDDLNVFAHNVNAILSSVLATKDLSLCQHAEPVFDTFCSTLDGELFNGDFEFVDSFTKLSESFLSLGVKVPQNNMLEWKAIALNASKDLANCQNISQGNGNYIVKKIIPFILSEIHADFTRDQLQSEVKSHASEHDLSRYNTARSTTQKNETVTLPPATQEAGETTPREIATDELAINSLKAFFSSNSSGKLISCAGAICHYISTTNVDRDWSATLVEMVTNWVPVQLRFLILSVITNQLGKSGKTQEQLIYLHAISTLLSSSVNMVGLSVMDILRQLLNLQSQTILDSNGEVEQLVYAYSEAVSSFATHIYYQNQIIDIVGELLVKVKECTSPAFQKQYANPKKLQLLISVYLDNIKNTIITASSNSTVQRATVQFDLFEETFGLISYNNQALFSEPDLSKIQFRYIDLLTTVFNTEYANFSESEKEDHNSLISDAKLSTLNQFYEELEVVANYQNYSNYESLIKLMQIVVQKFGINAIVNLFPFFFEWQLQEESNDKTSSIYKDNIGYLLSYFGAEYYQDSSLKNALLARIDYRKSNNLWEFSAGIPNEKSNTSSKLLLLKDDVSGLIGGSVGTKYSELIFNTHYKYKTNELSDADDASDIAHENSFISQGGPSNFGFTLFPPAGENHSIRSAPLSARSLLNGRLQAPKVQELRKAISGTHLKSSTTTNGVSKQQTDLGSILQDLDLSTTFDDRGSLAFR